MKDISSILTQSRPEPSTWDFKNRRQELIQLFVDRINQERIGTNFPPVTAKRLNCQYLWTMTTWDLDIFYKQCGEYGNFGKCFFGCFKKK